MSRKRAIIIGAGPTGPEAVYKLLTRNAWDVNTKLDSHEEKVGSQ